MQPISGTKRSSCRPRVRPDLALLKQPLATHLLHATSGLTGSAVQFGAIYLLSHGVVKIVLVTALLRNKRWAYPG